MNILNTVDLELTKNKIYERLKPSGWGDKLRTFILSGDFDLILNQLLEEAKRGDRFTPVLKQAFRAFEECPYNKLRVVVFGQDPYYQNGVADGIAFSSSNDGRVQTSLKYIFQEIEDTVYPNGYVRDPDLKRWSNQGVLMLNTAFTTKIGKVGAHYAIWQPFLTFLLDVLAHNNPKLVYVFMGAKAKEWSEMVPDTSIKIFTTHPASAAYAKQKKWDSGDVFNKVNNHLSQKIVW